MPNSDTYNPFLQATEEVTDVSAKGSLFFDFLQTIVVAAAICVVIYLFVAQPNEVKGESMDPTFKNAQLLLTDKITQRFGEYKGGDVIIFKYNEQEDFIKRVIGVPGDKVSVRNGSVFVNDKELDEYYLPKGRTTNDGSFLKEGQTITVPEDHYIVMGDNRNHSRDSRDNTVGFVSRKQMKGKVFLVYWPIPAFRWVGRDELKYK